MPNWCYNQIEVSDPKGQFCKELSSLNREDYLFNSMLPTDDCYAEWGTRDVSIRDFLVSVEKDYAYFQGDTAWGPPIEFFQNMSAEHGISVTLYYEEPGMDFTGETKIENGEIVSQENYQYDGGVYILRGFEEWLHTIPLDDVTEENVLQLYPYLSEEEAEIVLEMVQV